MEKIELHAGEVSEVIESLSYSTELLTLSARDLQALGLNTKGTVKKVLRQVDALDTIIMEFNDCQSGKNSC